MNFFLDTSALIKRYIQEVETNAIQRIFNESEEIIVSFITELESTSTFRRLLVEAKITNEQYDNLLFELEQDFEDFIVIPFDTRIKNIAKELITKYQIKTLDSIQLATYSSLDNKNIPMVVYDEKLYNAAKTEFLNVLKPSS